MKKIFITTIAFAILLATNTAQAALKTKTQTQNVEKNSFSNTYSVVKFFKEYENAANNYNHNTINEIYSKDYLNSDGFNKHIIMNVVKDTWKSYPGIKYNVKINSVNIYNDKAIVNVSETAKGYAKTENENVGEFVSNVQTLYFLKKEDDAWKITNDNTIKEQVRVSWGDAKYATISLDVPLQLSAGQEYIAKLTLEKPKNILAIGSITSEKITYPQKPTKEIFRKFSQDGIIERIMKTNTDSVNEFVSATVGFSRPTLDENQKLNVKLTGYACVIERLHVVPINKYIELNENKEQK